MLVLFQFGVESITPLKAETCRTDSSSEPISMECARTVTHLSSHAPHAPPVCSDPSCLQLFPSISLPCFFFLSSLFPLPSVFPEVPPTPCVARIGGKGRDTVSVSRPCCLAHRITCTRALGKINLHPQSTAAAAASLRLV